MTAKELIIGDKIYVERPKPKKPKNLIPEIFMFTSYYEYGGSRYERKIKGSVNLVEEYKLILEKKNPRPKWERDQIEHLFHLLYMEVDFNPEQTLEKSDTRQCLTR